MSVSGVDGGEKVVVLRSLDVNDVEALRLHPVVPGNSRSAVRDTVLPLGGGPDGKSPLFVPKGTLLIYHVYSMHRREDLYGEDANEFKPERWETLRPGWVSCKFLIFPRYYYYNFYFYFSITRH